MALNVFEELESSSRNLKSARAMARNRVGIVEKQISQEKAVTSGNAQYAHGQGGIFNVPGTDPSVFGALVRPKGFAAQLPLVPSLIDNPLFQIITGLAASTGSEPTNEGSTPISAGAISMGFLTAPYGRIIRKTQDIALNRMGRLNTRAEPMDLRVVNDIGSQSPWVPDPAKNQDFLNSELGKQYWALGLELERTIEPILFTGDPGNITGVWPDYGFRAFAGYSRLINTGHTDAVSGNSMAAADSVVVAWNNALVSGTTTLNGQPTDIVTTMGAIINFLYSKADRQNMLPVEWVIAVRYDLFFEMTRLWPCSYLTNACTTAVLNNATQFVSGNDQIAMRDDMRQNRFLWVNGMKIPVILTDGIPETTGAGSARSDIYVIPRSAAGNFVTYLNYFDFTNANINQALQGILGSQFTVSNNGLYLWTFDRSGYLANLWAKVEPRLVLRTPWLAARITNVGYNTAIHTVDGFAGSLYPAPAGGATVGQIYGGITTPLAV